MNEWRFLLPSVLSLLAVTACATVLLIRYSSKRGAASLLLAAAVLARAGHHGFGIWIRCIIRFHPQYISKWSGLWFSGRPHPPGLAFHVWQNKVGIDNLFCLLSYVFLIILISLELRTRRDDKIRSDALRELDHSI